MWRTWYIFLASLSVAAGQTRTEESTAGGVAYAVVASTNLPIYAHGLPIPSWTGGALVYVVDPSSSAPQFRGFDRTGREVLHCSLTLPKASLIDVYSGGYARGLDGSLLVTGSAYSNESQAATFFSLISSDCRTQTVVRLTPFAPRAAAIAADGTIWLAGTEHPRSAKEPFNRDASVIRRFDKSGKLLRSLIAASALDTLPDAPNIHPAEVSRLVVSRDRVGWFAPFARKYIEFSPDGAIIGQYRVPEAVSKRSSTPYVALCDDGGVFLGHIWYRESGGGESWGMFNLDRGTGNWNFVPQTGKWGMLYGCDGNSLATATEPGTITWLRPSTKR